MNQDEEAVLRPTVKAHLPADVAAALERVGREIYEHHMGEGVLQGSSFVLVRGRCALEELRVAVAALEEVRETAESSSLSGEEQVVAGRVQEILPGLREAVVTLAGAFDG